MKKIALLFTILCAGALYGIEKPNQGHYIGTMWENIPTEVKPLIITYLNKYDTLNAVINAIKATSQTNRALKMTINEIYGFTALVHILAHTFNSTTGDVAIQFGTPTAKHYIFLACKLMSAIINCNINEVAQLIEDGVDVNYNFDNPFYNTGATLLTRALAYKNVKIIKLLLNAGANPNFTDKFGRNALEWVHEYTCVNKKTKQLLEEAMKK